MTGSPPEPPELPSSLVSLWRSLRIGYRFEPLLLVVAGVTTLAAALPDALFAVGFKLLTESVVRGSQRQILVAGLLLAGLATGSWLLNVASARINLRLAERAAVPIEAYVARLHSSLATIDHQERPDHLDRLSILRDHGGALSQLYRSLFSTLGAVARLLLTIGLLMSVSPMLGLLAVFAIPTAVVAVRRAGIEKRIEEDGAQGRRLARHWFLLGSTASAGKEVRVAGVQERVGEAQRAAWEGAYAPLARARSVSAAWESATWAVFGAGFVVALGYVALGPQPPDVLAGSVALVLAAGSRLSQYVGQTVSETHFLRGIWLDASRRLAWLENYSAAYTRAADLAVPQRLRQGIRFEDVSFHYPGTSRPVLDGVSLTLPAGSVVAVVGENGAGKTTLVKLLCRFYDPTSGRITVDGADLARLSPDGWRARIAGTFQDFFRFEFRAVEAIGLGDLDRIDDQDAVQRAVERAGAGDVLRTFPAGLDTQLGNTWHGGVDPSFGQWQKLALARGFMRDDPLLLILDEPTAALDAETEHALFERYAIAARAPAGREHGRITVLVSHRFSTLRMADLIIVLDGANVLETGSHEELMTLGGRYSQLYRMQAAGYR
jgi:ATP-binding cassette, subfamily B, bacterial